MVVGFTVDLSSCGGVVVGDDSELLPPAFAVDTAAGGTVAVAVAWLGDGTPAAARGEGWAEAAKSEVALAERNPSERRRFIRG